MLLQEQLNELFQDRAEPENCMSDNEGLEYKELYKKYDDFYKNIGDMLPKNAKCLLFELDSLLGEIITMAAGRSYKQGLKDGLELAKSIIILDTEVQLTPQDIKGE